MRIYHYAPSVYVYAAVVGKGGKISAYYDLTEDVSSCSVTRASGSASSASVTLLNRQGKYNGVFTPFDMITIITAKDGEKTKLFTGYMTDVTRWTLYEKNFEITCKDCIYRLERLYFDPHLPTMRTLMADEYSGQDAWAGYGGEMYKLLNIVGGVEPRNIRIGEMPVGVMNWARRMYVAQKSDYEQSEQIAQDMFEMIMNSSTTVVGGTMTSKDPLGTNGATGGESGGVTGGNAGTLDGITVKQKRLIDEAYVRPYRGYGMCAAWVWWVFHDAGFEGPCWGDAREYYNRYCKYTDKSQLLPGMIIAVPTSGATGSTHGHIGIYVGDNKVRHNADYLKDSSLDDWIACYTAHGSYAVGWGWYDGNDLTR